MDGKFDEWTTATRLDTTATGTLGYALHGLRSEEFFSFAIIADAASIGPSTTIWLDTDLNRSTGHQIFGFAGGAEFNVEVGADGVARLYTGGAGESFVADLPHAYDAAGTSFEVAVPRSLIGAGASQVRVFADANNAAFLPNDYASMDFIVGTAPVVQVGAIALDGSTAEWDASTLLHDTASAGAPGYRLRGDVQGEGFVLALESDGAAIGAGTTIWLDTDLNRSTGHQIFGFAGGAEFNVEIGADGVARLSTGGAGESFVATLDAARSADGRGLEISVPGALVGGPKAVRVLADVNDAVFLPDDYGNADLRIEPDPLPAVDQPGLRVGIVYSETTAKNFYDVTAYGQLFMSAQNQAMQAGVPFDLLSERDLLDPARLAAYDALVFPGFSHVKAADAPRIHDALRAASQEHGTGLIVAGNFLTNDETGAALPGNSYARMTSLLGVTLDGFGQTQGLKLQAKSGASPILDGYAPGEVVGSYTNASYLNFRDVTGSGQALFSQVTSTPGAAPQTHDAVIATELAARNVHFATDAIIGNNNILGEAIDWVARDSEPDLRLALTRGSSLFYARNDMDQSQETFDVNVSEPGIYDVMLPIVEKWYKDYGFTGSYYINVGAYPPDQLTNWTLSKPYYKRLLKAEGEIGSHSYTHPSDTNLLLPDQVTDALLAQRVRAYDALVDRGVPVWSPYALREDADPAVVRALAGMSAAQITSVMADALRRTDPSTTGTIDPSKLTPVERGVLEASYRFQFEHSKDMIERQLAIKLEGAAVPGAPERIDATREMIPFYDYLSGGYSGTGAGYPGAFGFLTPGEAERVYLAPNMSFDFSLIGFRNLTPEQAKAVWAAEWAAITEHATNPIVAFPWHDYGPTDWNLGDPAHKTYTLDMFTDVIARAARSGAEFLTGADLARRIESFAASSLEVTGSGGTVTAKVGSADAGRFALELGEGRSIASVKGWYAWDDDAVFLPRAGGTFEITTGPVAADVTRVAALPQRAELISALGNGSNLEAVFAGRGTMSVELKSLGAQVVRITGSATGAQMPAPDEVVLSFATVRQQKVTVAYLKDGATLSGTTGADVLIGNATADRLDGKGRNDTLFGGGGADTFVFSLGTGRDVALDFASGQDVLELRGSGFASAGDAYDAFRDIDAGLELSFGTSDRVLLAGLDFGDLSASDIRLL